jgi:hypothetical protein
MKSKGIEAFIRRSIKADGVPTDAGELQRLLDQMSTEEMQQFWMHFAADRAFSSTLTVPHWKTKEQQVRFQHVHLSWMFYPKEKDAGGKYIMVRKDLEEHIKTCLVKHIHSERESRMAYRRLPVFDKIHNMIGGAVLIMAIPSCIFYFLADNKLYLDFSRGGVLFFTALWGLYLLLGLVRSLLWRFRAQKGTQHDA